MDWRTLFLTTDGRIGRRDFWIGIAIIFGIAVVAGWIPVLGQLIALALIYPSICLQAKRLHDMGKTAWLMLVPMGVGMVCSAVAAAMGGMAAIGLGAGGEAAAAGAAMAGVGAFLVLILAVVVSFGFLLWVGLSSGDPGENRFGPPPVSLTGGAASPPTVA